MTDRERVQLYEVWKLTKGESWEPPNPRTPVIDRLVGAGYLRRTDGRIGFERIRDGMLAWTDAGRQAMLAIESRLNEASETQPAPRIGV
ncbi:hypothetical protein ACVIGB_000028 [Bradyrhizobium sp. USDA 4341]